MTDVRQRNLWQMTASYRWCIASARPTHAVMVRISKNDCIYLDCLDVLRSFLTLRPLLTFGGHPTFRSCRETQNKSFRASMAKKKSWYFWEAFGLLVSAASTPMLCEDMSNAQHFGVWMKLVPRWRPKHSFSTLHALSCNFPVSTNCVFPN